MFDKISRMITRSQSRKNSVGCVKDKSEYGIITRSRAKGSSKEVKFLCEDEVEIDFDGASRAWMRNKRKVGNGCYVYTE